MMWIRFITTLVVVIKLALASFFYVYLAQYYEELNTYNTLQDLTDAHSYYVIDTFYRSCRLISVKQRPDQGAYSSDSINSTIVNNVANLVTITDTIDNIQLIQKETTYFTSNYTFMILNSNSSEQYLTVNFVGIATQLINKITSYSQFYYTKSLALNLQDFLIFAKNTLNVYLIAVTECVEETVQSFMDLVSIIDSSLRLSMLIAISLISCMFLYIKSSLRIRRFKKEPLDLLFQIPQKFCFKYYSNCEDLLKYIINEGNSDNIDGVYSDASTFTLTPKENDTLESKYSIKAGKKLMVNTSRGNYVKKFDSTIFIIINIVLLNLLWFLIDYAFYSTNYLSFNLSKDVINTSEDIFWKNYKMNLYLNEFQFSSFPPLDQTNFTILDQDPDIYGPQVFQNISQIVDDVFTV